jgi:Uncharacterized ABC-type transport system, permease component
MIPYVVTIVAIAGFVGRVRPPAAAGRAYEGGGGQLAGYSVPNSRSPKSPSPGTMYPRSFSWRSIAAVKIGTSG